MNLGNNGALVESDVVAIFDALVDAEQVVVVDTAVPRPWRDGNNELIAQVAARYSNVKVMQWGELSYGHPEYFAPDGVHLVPTGVAIYVEEIAKFLEN
jgi:hypothetical protein